MAVSGVQALPEGVRHFGSIIVLPNDYTRMVSEIRGRRLAAALPRSAARTEGIYIVQLHGCLFKTTHYERNCY